MYLGQYEGIKIRATLKNGKIFEGVGEWYTQDIDNPDGIASICVGNYELYENEIADIKIITVDNHPITEAILMK